MDNAPAAQIGGHKRHGVMCCPLAPALPDPVTPSTCMGAVFDGRTFNRG